MDALTGVAESYDNPLLQAKLMAVEEINEAGGINGLTWSGAIGDDYSFDENGDVVGLSNVVVQVLPVAERTEDNLGYEVLGPAPVP